MTESEVEQRIAPIYTAYAGVETTILASLGEIQIHLRAWSEDAAATERMLQEMVERITLALGEGLFTTNGETLEEVVARELTMNQATVATAESCTGGLLVLQRWEARAPSHCAIPVGRQQAVDRGRGDRPCRSLRRWPGPM